MIPSKLQKGQQFKPTVVDKVNEIIDYLKTQRIIGDNKTIKVNQLTNNVAITALPSSIRKGGGASVEFDHPFKLKIGPLQDEDSNESDGGNNSNNSGNSKKQKPVLKISQARILVSGDESSRIYFCYDENDIGLPTHLKLPEKDGQYNVIGYACFDTNAPSNEMNALGWGAGCVYADYIQSDTSQFTSSCGFFHFVIGTIKVETDDEGNQTCSVTRQLLFSSLEVHDCNVSRNFRGRWQKQTYPEDGKIVEDLLADVFVINQGYAFCDGVQYYVSQFKQSSSPQQQNIYCLQLSINGQIAQIKKISYEEWIYFDEQLAIYSIPICMSYPSYSSGVGLVQYVEGHIFFNTKGQILLNQEDQLPSEYFQEKIKYPTLARNQLDEDQKKIYAQGQGYIIGITTDANEQSTEQKKVKNLYDELYWDWTTITDYDKEKTQVLQHDEGNLKWAAASSNIPQVSGSLKSIIEIKVQKNDEGVELPLLRYPAQFGDNQVTDDSVQFIIQNHNKTIGKLTWDNGVSGQGVMGWNYEKKQPMVTVPPSATDQISTYVLTGSKNKELSWVPYQAGSGNISLSGSIENVFEIYSDPTSGQFLHVWTEGIIDTFSFLCLDQEGGLNFTTFQGEGEYSLFIWDNVMLEPLTYDCLEYEEDNLYFLTGDKTNGIWWQSIYNYVGTVCISDDDPDDDYLFYKVTSIDESIVFFIDNSGDIEKLDIGINPEWFFSSDESVVITYTEDGYLDFTGAGMVQVTEEDTPGFLIDKLGSSLEHITVDVASDNLGMFVDLNLNPDTFISSDESIIIEATEDGYIDFTGAGMVQVTEEDTPGFLIDKLGSSLEHITIDVASDNLGMFADLNLNPDTFISSDESVIIEATEDGYIDFYGAGMVQVTGDDDPAFLIDKVDSSEGHLTIDVGSHSGDTFLDLNIDTSIFISSDGSVEITGTEDGTIDFTGAGKVQVHEEDAPGYLASKIASSTGTILVEDGGSVVNLEINPDAFTSSDDSIEVIGSPEGIDLTSKCKVKCTENDTPDFLNTKINVDPSIAGLITLEKQDNQILIKSALEGSGLLAIQDGKITTISAPSEGQHLLACKNGAFSWIQASDCENACEQ